LRELEVALWQEATPAENRIPIEELIDAVVIHPDHLQVLVNGAPPLNVILAEVGLRDPGTKTSVSEGDLNSRQAAQRGGASEGIQSLPERGFHPPESPQRHSGTSEYMGGRITCPRLRDPGIPTTSSNIR
jgi:hypothetical protein